MQFGWLIAAAVEWLNGTLRGLGGSHPWLIVAIVAAVIVPYALIEGRRRKQRWQAHQVAVAEKVQGEAFALKEQLRLRLSEPPQLFEDHLNGAPTVGARLAFEGDIEAAAASVLREAGGQRGKAKELLRKRIHDNGSAGTGKLNGSEAGYWRQLGALSLVDGAGDALAAYTRAADLAPDDPDAQMLLGVLHLRAGNLTKAEAAFRRQIELGNDAPEGAPARYRGQTMLGDVRAARHAHDEALAAYREAQREVNVLLEASPDQMSLRRDLSVTYDRIGDVLVDKGEFDAALQSYRQGQQIAEALARGCGRANLDLHRDLSVSYDRIGDILEKKGDLQGALESFTWGLAIAKALAKRDPANAEWQWDLSVSYERVADLLSAQGQTDEALKHYRRGLALAEELSPRKPTDAGWQRDLAVSFHKIGSLEALRGNASEARDLLERGRDIIARLDRIAAYQAQWRSDLSKFDDALRTLHA